MNFEAEAATNLESGIKGNNKLLSFKNAHAEPKRYFKTFDNNELRIILETIKTEPRTMLIVPLLMIGLGHFNLINV